MAKWSKECKGCGRRYPTSVTISKCFECDSALERTDKEPTVSEQEYKDLSYIHGRVIPGALPVEVREQMEQEWEALEAEAERRAPWYSVADLIGDSFTVRSA